MSNKKQTAVEYLYEKMFIHKGHITIEEYEQAKEMHKSEHCKTYINAMKECMINPLGDELYQIDAEQYYNETYEN